MGGSNRLEVMIFVTRGVPTVPLDVHILDTRQKILIDGDDVNKVEPIEKGGGGIFNNNSH